MKVSVKLKNEEVVCGHITVLKVNLLQKLL